MNNKIQQVIIILRQFANAPEENLTEQGRGMKELAQIILELLES